MQAILPLLATLAAAQDVRPVLHRRFDMPRWFASQGISAAPLAAPSPKAVSRRASRSAPLPMTAAPPTAGEQMLVRHIPVTSLPLVTWGLGFLVLI